MIGRKSCSVTWFLLGLGSSLQIVASLSMTEAYCLAAAPMLMARELPRMRRDGVLPFFQVSLWVVVGGLVACVMNKTPGYFFLRGMAVACILPCAVTVSYHYLRRDMYGIRWLFVGAAISSVLCTFVFQTAVETTMLGKGATGAAAAEAIMSGPIYWISRLSNFVMLPIKGWYLSTPMAYSCCMPFFFSAFSLMTSQSGRSTALCAFMSAGIILIGKKRIKSIRSVSRHFGFFVLAGFVGLFAFKVVYQKAAVSGWLGEGSRKKYEVQTKGKTDIISLIVGGRMDSFAGYLACVDKPIIGFGPWAIDDKNYTEEFLRRFGNADDYDKYVRNLNWEASQGMAKEHFISAHSSVVIFWLQFGVAGLIFWLYVFYVIFRYMRQDVAAIPQWYAWLCAGVPSVLWAAFFSPFASRFGLPLFIVACLLARAVRRGKIALPPDMQREIVKSGALK